eukprot:jgi/Tetstr1/427208/TSEL_017396.t1
MSPGFSVSVCMSELMHAPPPPGAGGSSDQWPALDQPFGLLSPASWGQVSSAAAQHAVQIQQAVSAEQMSQLLALMRDIAHDAATAAVRAVLQAHGMPRLSLQHETAQPEPVPPPPAAPAQPELVPPPPAAPAPPPHTPTQPEPVPAAVTSAPAAIPHTAIPSVAAILPAPSPPTRPRSPERTMKRIGAGFQGSVNFLTMCTGPDVAFAIIVLRRFQSAPQKTHLMRALPSQRHPWHGHYLRGH